MRCRSACRAHSSFCRLRNYNHGKSLQTNVRRAWRGARLFGGFFRGCNFGAGKNLSALDRLSGTASEIACGTFLACFFRYFLASPEFLTAVPASEPSSNASDVASFGLSWTKDQNISTIEAVFAFLRLMKLSRRPRGHGSIPVEPIGSME